METSLTDQYYLKALDQYNYSDKEAYESLSYALSYDEMHAPSNCLMGMLQMYMIKDYGAATHYFEMALISDKSYVETYTHYALLSVWTSRWEKASSLISMAKRVRGINWSIMNWIQGLSFEYRGLFKQARKEYNSALEMACTEFYRTFYKAELTRVKSKMKVLKKRKK